MQLKILKEVIYICSSGDKTIFKDYKKSKQTKKKKTVIEEESVKRKSKTTFYRLIAIT